MIKPPSDSRDHKAWLAYWGEQAVAAIADAVAHPEFVYEDNRLRYAINCARMAHSRALKVKPKLKPETLQAIQRRLGVGAVEAMRIQEQS